MKVISLDTSIKELVREHPAVLDIMVELGFTSITNPAMIATVGKYMSLRKGSELKRIDIDMIVEKFREKGFEFE